MPKLPTNTQNWQALVGEQECPSICQRQPVKKVPAPHKKGESQQKKLCPA